MKKVIALCIFVCAFAAGSAFAQQNKVVVIPFSSANKIQQTYFTYNGISGEDAFSFNYQLNRILGSFTKTRDSTVITVHWRSHVRQIGLIGQFGHYTLRLNGQAGDGGIYTGSVIYNSADTTYSPIDNWEYWSNLPAGTYNIEVWIRGNLTSATLNWGNFTRPVLVEEYLATPPPAPAPREPAEAPAGEQDCSEGVGPGC